MRRWAVVAAVGIAFTATNAHAIEAGVGMAAGANFPVYQEDNAASRNIALRIPVNVLPLLTIEPFLASTAGSHVDATFGGLAYNRRGFDVVAFGATFAVGQVGLGPRWPLFPFLAIGAYRMDREGATEQTHVGYEFGVGYARQLPKHFALDVRSDFNWIPTGETSRKYIGLNLGLKFQFYPSPQPAIQEGL